MSDTITRFAPSPTGHLHIGGGRTALFCWALARRDGGRFLLRVEDTDQKRSNQDAVKGILEDLAWLGIDWDEGPEFARSVGGDGGVGGDPRGVGPFFQSERLAIYNAAFDALLAKGVAYPAFESPDELNAMRKDAEAAKKTFVYRQRADYNHAEALERAQTEEHVLRFRMPAEAVTVVDEVLGEISFPYEELDDFIIRKRDGFPTYHFAVTVDDEAMGVTHVLRGQEHLNNTPKHVALMHALGYGVPRFAHLSIISNPDGSKMSKRDKDKAMRKAVRDTGLESHPASGVADDEFRKWLKDKSRQLPPASLAAMSADLAVDLPEIEVHDFRAAGYLPGVVVNYIALLGWNPGAKAEDGTDLERFDAEYLREHFDLKRVGKTSAKFDRDKLLAFNADTIQHALSDDEFAGLWLAWARAFDADLVAWAEANAGRWSIAASAARPRAKTLKVAADAIAFARVADDGFGYDEKAVKKVLLKGDPNGLAVLPEIRSMLEGLDDWTPDAIDAALNAFATERELGMGKVAQPLRVALTGTAVSPPPGLTLGILPRDSVMARIDRCLAEHREAASA